DPLVNLALEQYLSPMLHRGIDTLVLGCTHYPILKGAITRHLGDRITVIDSADYCAQDVARNLATRALLRPGDEARGWLKCFVTDDPLRFSLLASRIMGEELPPATWVSLGEAQEAAPAPVRIAG